jgi:hypothetical protein
MSIIQSDPHGFLQPDDQEHRWMERLALVASDLAAGTTDVRELKTLLADGVEVPPAANLVKASADPIGHANVSAARALGVIVPGP